MRERWTWGTVNTEKEKQPKEHRRIRRPDKRRAQGAKPREEENDRTGPREAGGGGQSQAPVEESRARQRGWVKTREASPRTAREASPRRVGRKSDALDRRDQLGSSL